MKYIKTYEFQEEYREIPYKIGEYVIMAKNYARWKEGESEYPYSWPYPGMIFQLAEMKNNSFYFKSVDGQRNIWKEFDFINYCRRLTPEEYESNKLKIEDYETKKTSRKYNL